MFTKIQAGQRYKDLRRNRTLLILEVESGETSHASGAWKLHPQINYAKCRADYDDAGMNIVWIAVHALLNTAHYKKLPK